MASPSPPHGRHAASPMPKRLTFSGGDESPSQTSSLVSDSLDSTATSVKEEENVQGARHLSTHV